MTDTSREAVPRFRATVKHEGEDMGLDWLEEFWAVRAEDYSALLTRAETAEARVAEAVEAVEMLRLCREMQAQVAHHEDPLMVRIDATLAKIKGETNDE